MSDQYTGQMNILGGVDGPAPKSGRKSGTRSTAGKNAALVPENLGKPIKLPVPDFSDPNRRPTCLEADFPIAQINALSNLEGNAGKPIYQMSKWWARRRSSVFRSLLIAAATEAPADPNEAAKLVWDHYYCNHQKAGSFKQLKVLDPFMGGGTTLVEGSRLGMQMTGVDLNPVAWFVVKNELACSDPEQVKALFDEIERQVKPQIQPFYTTTCPRGHQGRWLDVATGEPVALDPIELPPDQRSRYRWEGPEVIYTFWAKHGPCQARGCGHRTPIFRTPVIAEKKLSTGYLDLTCPGCGTTFHAELGETRMAPGAERIIVPGDTPFTELSQGFARLLADYDKGSSDDTLGRALALKGAVPEEPGLCCPQCGTFSGKRLVIVMDKHLHAARATARKKKDFALRKKPVQMYLLIHPEWLQGASGFDGDLELGGWAGAPADATSAWYARRLDHLRVIEVRGKSLPELVTLADGAEIETGRGTVTQKSAFQCANCGRISDITSSEREAKHPGPVMAYALQCYCPQCEIEGYIYGGRYFKAPDDFDLVRLIESEREWLRRAEADLSKYWPRSVLPYAWETHVQKGNLTSRGYTHWWKMFNSRQLLVHTNLLKSIAEASEEYWSLDVREQVLGAFQQYLRNQNMFCFWDTGYDKLVPMMSNNNFHPKSLVIENCVFHKRGRGNLESNQESVISGLEWANNPWECFLLPETEKAKSERPEIGDPLLPGNKAVCGSSTDLSLLSNEQFDLVVTDPPFGNNLFYADLADFFHVWLRLPLRQWYEGLPEAAYFESEFTPKALQAIDDPAQHPDDREGHEKGTFIELKHLARIRELTCDDALEEKDPNPLYRPQPSSEFYCQTLSACWTEAGRRLKDGGIMAFTFHHNEDQAWIDVLRALFDAGYVLVSTYPVRSDETKGDAANAAFGSKKIEYDIIHVCRKRIHDPEPVSWARMRRWVKEEAVRLKELLEHTHGKTLPESDLRVILRGKSLEFYSRHYGQVFTGDGQVLEVRDALLGINQLLDDLLEDTVLDGGLRPPDSAEPASRLYLRLFRNRTEMERDELHKTLRGTGIAQGDLEARGWIRVVGRIVHVVPIHERLAYFTERGRNRKVIKADLDQAHFLIGAAYPNSGLKIESELGNPNFRVKKSVDDILNWVAEMDNNSANRIAARTAAQLVSQWRTRQNRPETRRQLSLFEQLEMEQ